MKEISRKGSENNLLYKLFIKYKKIEDIKNIPVSFFREEYKELDYKIKRRYSAEGFIEEIFDIVKKYNK